MPIFFATRKMRDTPGRLMMLCRADYFQRRLRQRDAALIAI